MAQMNGRRSRRNNRCGLFQIFVISTVYKVSTRLGGRRNRQVGHLPRARHLLQLGIPGRSALDRPGRGERPPVLTRLLNRVRRQWGRLKGVFRPAQRHIR